MHTHAPQISCRKVQKMVDTADKGVCLIKERGLSSDVQEEETLGGYEQLANRLVFPLGKQEGGEVVCRAGEEEVGSELDER